MSDTKANSTVAFVSGKCKKRIRMKIVIEKEENGVAESCCFCTGPTLFWNRIKDVAVCPSCADSRKQSEIPDKPDWLDAQRRRDAQARRDAGLPALPQNLGLENFMTKSNELLLNRLLPSGWRARFVPAEDESVDDEFEICHLEAQGPRFSLQCLSSGGYSLNEFVRADDGSIKTILSYPETDGELRNAARRVADAIGRNPPDAGTGGAVLNE